MNTLTTPESETPMKMLAPAETRTVLENIRWETFVELADQRRGSVPRMTFDEGVLELMSPRHQHERIGRFLGRLVETFTEVRGMEIQSVGSTTFKCKDLQKAFEADESYYIQHAEQIRPKEEIDLTIDPPPDLVIEVEITTSAIKKLALFAAIGAPEVWRHDGKRLFIHRLREQQYEDAQQSTAITGLDIAMAETVLAKRFDQGETALIRSFRESLSL